ncbi:MAG: membrane protein insertase YidC [Lewinella sp.]|nr:membrane protein insertase YidC [Lewinella sp.]
MDRNQVIGIVLIFALFIVYQQFLAPSPEELEEQQRIQDSLARVAEQQLLDTPADSLAEAVDTLPAAGTDSTLVAQRQGSYGVFAAATVGEEKQTVLENELLKLTFSSKGGRIVRAELKDYAKMTVDTAGNEIPEPLYLLEDDKNRFEYLLPIPGAGNGFVRTGDLFFTPSLSGNTLRFRADVAPGQYIEQVYTLAADNYLLDYDLRLVGLQQVLANDAQQIELTWLNYLDKLEINETFERRYSTIYYKETDDDPTYCSCTSSDTEELPSHPIKWISSANQFFNTALIADDGFAGGIMATEMLDTEASDLKLTRANMLIPYNHGPEETFAMQLYVGPNEFNRLRAIGYDLQDVIPYGRSFFGAINRWMIRPLFNFFDNITGNKGVAILLLTLLVKLLVFPLTYRMLYSQQKMAAMKPYMAKMKEKYKDDQQTQQMETMKLYREYGVNPLGGCLPMLLQLPIWFALYRYFPADITFRQEGFLWATDLSSYDVIARLPFEVPMGFGSHLSLFAILWAVTTLIYTFYNTQHMDYGSNPAMKYLQYIMPVMFLGFFNSYASGLTAYLFFSNLINITQTIVTKNFIIDHEKIRAKLEENRKKPKKKGGFQERLAAAMEEQKRKQEEIEAQRKKGKK